jgi:glutathione S-transferase
MNDTEPSQLILYVISLRYSSWSMRALLALLHAGAEVEVKTVALELTRQGDPEPELDTERHVRLAAERLAARRALGSVTGYFPVLSVAGEQIHEALAICEWAAERYPEAGLWPRDALPRARARALSVEMASNFINLRQHMSCHVFARVPGFVPNGPTRVEITRIFELMRGALSSSGGPFLFGDFGIVDAMYFPVLTRFETYGVALPPELRAYAEAMKASRAVTRWRELALQAPAIPIYDDYIRGLGGEVVVPSM